MWKAVYDSVRGTSHIDVDVPCQDVCRVLEWTVDRGTLLLACSADGAGSASHSDEGAEIACDAFVRVAQRELRDVDIGESLDRETVLAWCKEMRSQIEDRARELDVDIRQLACTFLAAVVGQSTALFLQIGDGAIVTRDEEGYRAVFWPQSGEFANTTNFLTDVEFEDRVEWTRYEERVDELAMFTDGLERLALRFADRSVHDPFLTPMLAAIRDAENTEEYFELLRQFLDSPKVNERTNDDKTLILATRLNRTNNDDAVR